LPSWDQQTLLQFYPNPRSKRTCRLHGECIIFTDLGIVDANATVITQSFNLVLSGFSAQYAVEVSLPESYHLVFVKRDLIPWYESTCSIHLVSKIFDHGSQFNGDYKKFKIFSLSLSDIRASLHTVVKIS